MSIGRNDPCPCGSGRKLKKCCVTTGGPTTPGSAVTTGLTAALRMKGGVSYDPEAHAFRAIVHSWDNVECIGKPREWKSDETFGSEDAAMDFYKANIRPGLARLMSDAAQQMKNGTTVHRRLE